MVTIGVLESIVWGFCFWDPPVGLGRAPLEGLKVPMVCCLYRDLEQTSLGENSL